MTLDIRVETITPNGAAKILASNNEVNRKLREKTVLMIARDIKDGSFNGLNGETIKFGEDGMLKDGQHRLAAIVESNTPTQVVVAYNVPNESQSTIDMGAKRNYADLLHMRGEINTPTLAAITKQVALREYGLGVTDGRMISYVQQDKILEKYPELRDITREVQNLHNYTNLLPQSVMGLCLFTFGKIDEEDASFFLARVADGQNLERGNPIYALRRRIEILKEGGNRPSIRMLLGCTIIAWNAWRDGKDIVLIKFKAGGYNPDPLPEPH